MIQKKLKRRISVGKAEEIHYLQIEDCQREVAIPKRGDHDRHLENIRGVKVEVLMESLMAIGSHREVAEHQVPQDLQIENKGSLAWENMGGQDLQNVNEVGATDL